MRLAIGCDHGGFALKGVLKQYLQGRGYVIDDVGCDSAESVDYPDFAYQVGIRVARGQAEMGIMIDGAGVGSAMALNKIPGIRAACCNDLYTAANSREHNHANVLTIGSMIVGPGLARQIVDTFLETQPAGGRHERRVRKIMELESLREAGMGLSEEGIRTLVGEIVDRLLGSSGRVGVGGGGAPENPVSAPIVPTSTSALPAGSGPALRLVTEEEVRRAHRQGRRELIIEQRSIVTPLARDTAKELGVLLSRRRNEP
jgi:ribose 5-phosphate isomerase B